MPTAARTDSATATGRIRPCGCTTAGCTGSCWSSWGRRCSISVRAGLWITDIEILREHYAETLREWNRRFQRNRDKVREIYDERFCRMWEFYLQVSEISFRYLHQMVFQIQIAKRQDAVPITRDYVGEWEREHDGAGSMAS